jgi:hypothetical protein
MQVEPTPTMDHSTQPMTHEMPPAMPQAALPAPGETQSAMDPMAMTVRDFIDKCKSIDPLVCMGIESFIEKNKMQFETPVQAEPVIPQDDITFSNTVNPPAPAQSFSLDQSPETLNFPA